MSAGKNGRLSVLLFDQQALLRRQCFAQFLELNGLRVRSVALEDCGTAERILAPDDPAIDLAVIDTGDEGCGSAAARTIFECLRALLPSVPIVVISDRDEWSDVTVALQLGARAYFPSSLDPKILIETMRFVRNGGTFVPRVRAGVGCPSRGWGSPRAQPRRCNSLGSTERELRGLEYAARGPVQGDRRPPNWPPNEGTVKAWHVDSSDRMHKLDGPRDRTTGRRTGSLVRS